MNVKRVTLANLPEMLRRNMKKLQAKVVKATHLTAEKGVGVAEANVPRAFGVLGDGIIAILHDTGATVRSTAPYSAAVELGSRPHMPPVEPIAAWVRLRGLQGLTAMGRVTRSSKARAAAPKAMARALRSMQTITSKRRSSPIDAPMQLAWAIAMKIKQEGTEPTFFMLRAVTPITEILDVQVKRALGASVDSA